jgi:predicted lipoprotein
MNKKLKYSLWLVLLVFVAYNSVYFKKLDSIKALNADKFNAKAYANKYLNTMLPAISGKAIGIDKLLAGLQASPQKTFDTYSNAMDIGSTRFFWVKGKGKITNIDESDIYLQTDSNHTIIKIAAEYVFGNAIRDASGLVHITDFTNTADLNNISAEINKIIRQQVLPPFKAKVKKGNEVEFTGAVEFNSSHLNINDAEVVPVSLKIVP